MLNLPNFLGQRVINQNLMYSLIKKSIVLGLFILIAFVLNPLRWASALQQGHEGKLLVIHADDFGNKKSLYEYFLKNDTETLKLENFNMTHIRPGTKIRVHGTETAGSLMVNEDSGKGQIEILEQSLPLNTTGTKSIAVMTVQYADQQLEYTNEQMKAVVDVVTAYYMEASFGQVRLSFRFFGPYTVSGPIPQGRGCDFVNEQEAITLADPEIDFSQYQLIQFITPASFNPFCPYGGRGSVGVGKTYSTQEGAISYPESEIYLTPLLRENGYDGVKSHMFAHELGHNFGLWHANAWLCGDTIEEIDAPGEGNCTSWGYMDTQDVMGGGGGLNIVSDFQDPDDLGKHQLIMHFNAYHKDALGWLQPKNITTINAEDYGQYTIDPIELPSTGTQLLRISRAGQYMYEIENRDLIGFDAHLTKFSFVGHDGTSPIEGIIAHITSPPAILESGDTHIIGFGPDKRSANANFVGVPPGRTVNLLNFSLKVVSKVKNGPAVVEIGPPATLAPIGSLENTSCGTGITGWTGDLDNPSYAANVHLYYDSIPSDPNPAMVDIGPTNVAREAEVCTGLKGTNCSVCPTNNVQCTHGYSVAIPNTITRRDGQIVYLRDGNPHTVRAYGINRPGTTGNDIELSNSPKTFTCASFTTTELKTLLNNFLTNNDSLYEPVDGKVNMFDSGYVIRWFVQ